MFKHNKWTVAKFVMSQEICFQRFSNENKKLIWTDHDTKDFFVNETNIVLAFISATITLFYENIFDQLNMRDKTMYD